MKKYLKFSMVAAVAMMATTVQAQTEALQVNALPQPAQQFISKYYDINSVSHALVEDEFFSSKEYKVVLTDGTELEFDSKGNWTDIDGELKPVPEAIIPDKIRQYVHKTFPNNKIVQISRSSRKYEVELTSGIDLDFDSKANFIRIDD